MSGPRLDAPVRRSITNRATVRVTFDRVLTDDELRAFQAHASRWFYTDTRGPSINDAKAKR